MATDAALEDLLDGLNPPQRDAVTHGEGPLLILAGAGSGKTRVLTHRIAWLLRTRRARADEILAITFTNKAAQEMRDRVELLVGRAIRAMWVMTFHSACARMLRADAQRLGYTRQFTIYDGADSRRLIKRCLDDLDIDAKRFTPRAMQAQISDAKNKLRSAEDYRALVSSFFEQTVADVYEHYERELHRMNAMDFDDLLVRAVNLLELFQEVRDRYTNAFRWVLVDEYQDTNHAQYRWLQLLTSEHRNLAVVGDDAQCLAAGTPVTMGDGATKPIEAIEVGDEVMSCYGSGDFRPAPVARTHRGNARVGIRIATAGGRMLVSTPDHIYFAGFRAGCTPQTYMTYVMRRDDRFRLTGDQRLLDRVFESVDSQPGGFTALLDARRSADVTRSMPRTPAGDRCTITFTLCADRRGERPRHLVSIGGRNERSRCALESLGLKARPSKDDQDSWRFEATFGDVSDAHELIRRMQALLPAAQVRRVARLGRARGGEGNSLPMIAAGAVRPGMAMFSVDGGYDVVERVEQIILDRPVYDIDVANTHNFVAGGVVVHNSIYSFRGADIGNILNFEDDFPDAHVVRLEQNYRSTQTILDAANAVISHNRGQMPKELWTDVGQGEPLRVRELADEHAEARFVAAEIERLVDEGVSRAEIAVFYRTNAQSRVLEDMLVRAQIAYQVIGGTKFYERAEIRDAVAYLTFLVNPQDAGAFTRIANSPRRGLGQTSLSRVLAHADAQGIPVWEAAEGDVPGLGTAARKALDRFMSTMQRLRERAEGGAPVGNLLEELLDETGYLDALRAERTIEAQGRLENLQELVQVAREYDATAHEGGSLGEFLQQIALLADADTLRDDEGLVTLMTLHNAKGLEFPIVFIIGIEDGVFPHARALDEGSLEEERRLCYVGLTRAMRSLTLTYARRRNAFGSQSFGMRSRFLDEIPAELTDAGSRPAPITSWGATTAPAPAADAQIFRTGEDVVHPKFGDGVVTGLEPGGIVVVRFAQDGSERKLMADYAPIRRR